VQRTISLTATPTGLAFGSGALWVANGLLGTVSRVDPAIDQVSASVTVTNRSNAGVVAAGPGSVWAVFGDSVLGRIDPRTNHLQATGVAGLNPSAIALENGTIWIANSGDNNVSQILPETATSVKTLTVGRQPNGIAVGDGAVWVTNRGDDSVTRIDLGSLSETAIPVGHGPTGIALGPGSVWVVNSDDGTVSRIDPGNKTVVKTITLGARPVGVAVS